MIRHVKFYGSKQLDVMCQNQCFFIARIILIKFVGIFDRIKTCKDTIKTFQGAASIENSFYRDSIPPAKGCITPGKNQDDIRVAVRESNTISTHTSILESVLKPGKAYPEKRRLVQSIAELCDIPGPSHEYVHVTSNIATIPGKY
uniref:Uncharacterized protein n=1 Tax=Dendroctonus ponderosae TaxID=77166 RepID=A0AAR5Q1M0_DENPD